MPFGQEILDALLAGARRDCLHKRPQGFMIGAASTVDDLREYDFNERINSCPTWSPVRSVGPLAETRNTSDVTIQLRK